MMGGVQMLKALLAWALLLLLQNVQDLLHYFYWFIHSFLSGGGFVGNYNLHSRAASFVALVFELFTCVMIAIYVVRHC